MLCPSCGHANIDGVDLCDACQASLTVSLPSRGMEKRILEGTVADLMPKDALSLGPLDTIEAAVEAMRHAKVGCMLILDAGRLVGVLSEHELLHNPAHPLALAGATGSLMRKDSYCLREDDSVADVFHGMAVSGHRHLPVQLKSGGYAVVSARDLLHYLCK